MLKLDNATAYPADFTLCKGWGYLRIHYGMQLRELPRTLIRTQKSRNFQQNPRISTTRSWFKRDSSRTQTVSGVPDISQPEINLGIDPEIIKRLEDISRETN